MIGCSVPTVTPSAVFGFGSQFPFGYTFSFGFLLGSLPPHPRLFSVFSFHLPSVYTLFSASVFSDTQLVFGFHWLLGSQRVSPSVLFGFPCFQFQFSVTSVTFGFPSYPSVFSCGTPVYLRFGLIAPVPTERHPHFVGSGFRPPSCYTFSSVHSLGPFGYIRGCFFVSGFIYPSSTPCFQLRFSFSCSKLHADNLL